MGAFQRPNIKTNPEALLARENFLGKTYKAKKETAVQRYIWEIAHRPATIEQSQRLRYQVLSNDGCRLSEEADGLDCDDLDPWCQHLVVRPQGSSQIIASTRLLTPDAARAAGRYDAAPKFEANELFALPGRGLEVSRLCIDPQHRNFSVISALLRGIGQVVRNAGIDHVFMCASVRVGEDENSPFALWRRLRSQRLINPIIRALPVTAFPDAVQFAASSNGSSRRLPTVLRTCIAMGGRVCGPPSYNSNHQCAEFLMLINVADIRKSLAQRFLLRVNRA